MRGLIAPVAAAALLTAGCAATGVDRSFTPREAPAKPPVAEETTPAPETVQVGKTMTVTIERPVGADPVLLKAFTDYYLASWRAVVGDDDTGYTELVEDPAAREAYDWVASFAGQRVKGTAKVYAMRVTAVVGDGAQVNACVDETGLRLTKGAPAWTRKPYLQAVVVHRGDDGVWRIKGFRHSWKGCAR
ncbi:hypothetical protein ACIBG8_23605 [Nonomuraea sp. NPDC050556]|uniref:hypothetical protein n=1 Tax=Nonomuraea sp. NPDC050556 TaxID=3364369 RepID=UPI0037A40775